EQLLELGLEAFFVARRGEAVDVARHLAELEREAFHLAERLEHRVGRLFHLCGHATARFRFRLGRSLASPRAFRSLDCERNRPRCKGREACEATEARGRGLIFGAVVRHWWAAWGRAVGWGETPQG